jgi:hypothetical protein
LGKIIQALGRNKTSAWEKIGQALGKNRTSDWEKFGQALGKYTSALENAQVPRNYDALIFILKQ